MKLNPDWAHRLWCEADYYPLIPDGLLYWYDTAPNYAAQADIAWKSILYHYGGVSLDADMECFQSVDHFFTGDKLVVWQETPGQLGGQIVGAPPKHAAVEAILEAAPESIRDQRAKAKSISYGAGPHLIQAVWHGRPDVEVRKPSEFYPYRWDEEPPDDYGTAYGAHHWTASWKVTDAVAG